MKMKGLFGILLRAAAVLTVLTAGGCADDALRERDDEQRKEMTLAALIDRSITRAAVTGTDMPTTRRIVASATRNEQGQKNEWFRDIGFVYDATLEAWRSPSTKYWPVSGVTDILAYSSERNDLAVRFGAGAHAADSLIIANAGGDDDLLVGLATGCEPQKNARIRFVHTMALVSFTVSSEREYDAAKNEGVTLDSIALVSAYRTGRLVVTRDEKDRLRCLWSDLHEGRAVIDCRVNVTTAKTSGGEMLLPPQDARTIVLYCTYHDGRNGTLPVNHSESVEVENPTASLPAWYRGYRTNYDLYFENNNVTVNVTTGVTEWDRSVPPQVQVF